MLRVCRKPRIPCPSRRLGFTLLALLAVLTQACGQPDGAAGFALELRKPDGWTYVSSGIHATQGEDIRYDAAALADAIANKHNAPLFALLKRAPPQSTLNPTFGINLERDAKTRGQTALALLSARVTAATRQGPFTLITPASATQLAGLPAAQAELRLSQAADGAQSEQTRVRLHLIVVDDVTLLLAETDALAGDNEASAAFAQIRASLRLPGAQRAP